ncbi:MAG: flagellar M-ring protein FliF [Spirochaetales bacterium]|nr:flagellar M-ring protein FliF [Spirochaetales bacterium]
MNEWFKKVIGQIKALWAKWKPVQKIIFFSVIAVVILAMILLFSFNSSPGMVDLFSVPVSDEKEREDIIMRLEQENVDVKVTPEGIIQVKDKATARRMKRILSEEDKIPSNVNPYDFFDNINQFTITEWDKNVQLRQAMRREIEMFIEAYPDIDNAEVILNIPEEEYFTDMQKETSVSVQIYARPGSDVLHNRKRIEGITRAIRLGIPGLKEENIVITDHEGRIVNDFELMDEFENLELAEKQLQLKMKMQREYRNDITRHLTNAFKGKTDRFSVTNVEIDFDFDKEIVDTTRYLPFEVKKDNPATPYDDSLVKDSVIRSRQTDDQVYKGSGINPQGPPGAEGQTPPAYKDVDGLVGTWEQHTVIENTEIGSEVKHEEKAPVQMGRVTVNVLVDGKWKQLYDEKGEKRFENGSLVREYVPPADEELVSLRKSIEGLVGFDKSRGDLVSVVHYQFDRSDEHRIENEKFLSRQRMQTAVIYSIIGLVVLIIAFIVFRLISREMERRRRLREEELSRQHQAMREAALRSAEEEGVDVQMSVEERARMEMQENAINMAREHPEDVAQLIRTWLIEE